MAIILPALISTVHVYLLLVTITQCKGKYWLIIFEFIMNGDSYVQLHLSQQTLMVRLAKVKYGFSLAQDVAILIDGHLKQKAMSLL